MNGEDRQKKKAKNKNKTAQQQKTMVIRNVASTKPCNAGFLITDESLMHFTGPPFRWSQFSFLPSSPCRNNDQFTKHMVMTENAHAQSPTSIRLTTILWWRQIAEGWRTLNSVYTLRKIHVLTKRQIETWGLFSSQYMCPASHMHTTFVQLSMMFDPRVNYENCHALDNTATFTPRPANLCNKSCSTTFAQKQN